VLTTRAKIEEVITSLATQIDLLVVWRIAAFAAKKFAGGVPTVFLSVAFPVEDGFVQSLVHPGGNMTGIGARHLPQRWQRRGCWIPPPPAVRWARCWGSAKSPPRQAPLIRAEVP
jgi:hypothetical protein